MVEKATSWIKDNSTLVVFLIAQLLAVGTAAAAIIAYSVKLETRVTIMETRGAPHVAERLGKIDSKITVLEQHMNKNTASIERIVEYVLKEMQQRQAPK
jgi:exopolysaccharide biosynthesis protein